MEDSSENRKWSPQVRAAAVGATITGIFGICVALLGNATEAITISVGEPAVPTATVAVPGPTVTVTAPAPTVTLVAEQVDTDGDSEIPRPAGATFLTDLTSITGYAEFDVYSIRGVTYPRAMAQTLRAPGCGEPSSIEYDLGDRYAELKIDAGLSDLSADSQARAVFNVYADDELIYDNELGLREVDEISLPVDGQFRLKLETMSVSSSAGGCSHIGMAVWGDPHLLSESR